jgi:hypothetical protein
VSEFNILFESFNSVFTSPGFHHFQILMISLWSRVTSYRWSGEFSYMKATPRNGF